MSDLFGTDVVLDAHRIIRRAMVEYEPDYLYAGLSGGHDSLCAAHVTSMLSEFRGCVHINTGIGIEQTREFVRRTCEQFNWTLREYSPPAGHTYREIVTRHGFPGPNAHRFMYSRLKQRAIRVFLREHPGRVMLVTGVRSQESRRRMGSVRPVQREGRLVWVAPIVHWTSDDKADYIAKHDLPENPVVKLMCYSGECLCGAYARPNELEELRLWFPDAAAEIDALQGEVEAAGKHAKWGEPPPGAPQESDPNQEDMPLCYSCNAKREAL